MAPLADRPELLKFRRAGYHRVSMLGLLAHTCNRSSTAFASACSVAVLVTLGLVGLPACSSGVNEGGGSSLSGGGGQGTASSTDTGFGMPTSDASANPSTTDGGSASTTTTTTTAGTEPDPSTTVDPSGTTTNDPTLEPTGTSGGLDCMSVTTDCANSTNLGPVGPGESVV